jgi:hypothetical protein
MLHRIKPKTAKLLKEKGFNYPCKMMYSDKEEQPSSTKMGMHDKPNDYEGFYAAYYLDEVCKVLRQEYNIHIYPDLSVVLRDGKYHWFFRLDNIVTNEYLYHSEDDNIYFDMFEHAQEAGIIKTIELI